MRLREVTVQDDFSSQIASWSNAADGGAVNRKYRRGSKCFPSIAWYP